MRDVAPSIRRAGGLLLVAWLPACGAAFDDLRPPAPLAGLGRGDAGAADAGEVDAGTPDAGALDAAPSADASPLADEPVVVATGRFAGRTGHAGAGTVRLTDGPDGRALVLGEDFFVSAVPGPFVVLSRRSELGARIEPGEGDLELGALRRERGSDRYPIPADAGEFAFAWVFCKPFGLEIARAALEEVP